MPTTTSTSPRQLPRGADWSRLSRLKTRPLNPQGMPTRINYAGIPILADGIDVHETALSLLQRHVSTTAHVLDVGAGAGAFTQRMRDHGYRHVEALEVNTEAFQVSDVPVHPLNLDGPWAQSLPQVYDALICLEVIEHLENPWQFARQCASAVRPGGILILSTPNIQSSRSRLEFLLKAEFRFFTRKDFETIGHLTSLTKDQIVRIFSCAGCRCIDDDHSRHKGIPRPTSGRRLLRAVLYALTYPWMSGAKRGEVSFYVFRHQPVAAKPMEGDRRET